jgi:mRNA interferase MazF
MPDSDSRVGIWDIVKVPFLYTSHPVQQFRPALVISGGLPDDTPFMIWVLMITSAANRPWQGDVALSDLMAAGLFAPSVVRTAKVATIEIARAQRIGRLPSRDRTKVKARLRAVLEGVALA